MMCVAARPVPFRKTRRAIDRRRRATDDVARGPYGYRTPLVARRYVTHSRPVAWAIASSIAAAMSDDLRLYATKSGSNPAPTSGALAINWNADSLVADQLRDERSCKLTEPPRSGVVRVRFSGPQLS